MDNGTDSCLWTVLTSLQTILSECEAGSRLASIDPHDAAALAELIHLGPMWNPVDEDRFLPEELEEQSFYVQLFPALGAPLQMTRRRDTGGQADVLYNITALFARTFTDVEMQDDYGPPYQYFTNNLAYIAETEIWDRADANGLYLRTVTIEEVPLFTQRTGRTAQKQQIMSTLAIHCGHAERG